MALCLLPATFAAAENIDPDNDGSQYAYAENVGWINAEPSGNGADGVHGVLELMREEVDRALAYCGQTSVQELEPNLINIPDGWGPGSRMAP